MSEEKTVQPQTIGKKVDEIIEIKDAEILRFSKKFKEALIRIKGLEARVKELEKHENHIKRVESNDERKRKFELAEPEPEEEIYLKQEIRKQWNIVGFNLFSENCIPEKILNKHHLIKLFLATKIKVWQNGCLICIKVDYIGADGHGVGTYKINRCDPDPEGQWEPDPDPKEDRVDGAEF